MDWVALRLSLELAGWTLALLLPLAIAAGRALAWREFRGKAWVEALLALPLVLPPTVLGYYLLQAFGGRSTLGQWYAESFGRPLVFSFEGLLLASVIVNIPFAVQPIQRALEAIPRELREAAACCGMGSWRILWRIELPLAWPGVLSALALTFTHTLGEFGVVLMVGGSIPGRTQTIAIAIYDRVQAFDNAAAGLMSTLLLVLSLAAIGMTYAGSTRRRDTHGR